jgi:excinuclease UvrABC nuclease subunit
MYAGDRARKQQLVKHGFRLPSALDNRPLRDDEFWERAGQTLFVSATPSQQELDLAERDPVDMVIRPTFVCDPVIDVRPSKGQLEDLLREVKVRADKEERTLAIALTKRDSEDLSSFLLENGVKSAYIHSGLSTVERSDALRALQSGDIDCLVGVNCLREGLDLPQVSLVAVLNTDSEGFLRSDTALLQIVGRAARNINGRAVFYANRTTDSMRRCIDSTSERRERQLEYNEKHGYQMRSTKGSSTMSFFDLLKDRIDAEHGFEVLIKKSFRDRQDFPLISASAEGHVPDASLTLTPTVETGHIPSSPGVYFWKDGDGNILYIGKAVKLRSRVRSYMAPNARHGARIQNMLQLAATVDVMLTPSERDGKTYDLSNCYNCGERLFLTLAFFRDVAAALILESKLIKHHQPRFNVLLKDDEHYPYICASVRDAIPRLSVVPKRPESHRTSSSPPRFRYFGPYTSFKEINRVLDEVELKYDLRAQNFQVRHGSLAKEEYNELFQRVLEEVFGGHGACSKNEKLTNMRREYEEAGMLFDSEDNVCRDVVTVLPVDNSKTKAVASVLQLRDGLVAGHFSYSCEVPFGLNSDQDYAAAVHTILTERHYPSGEESPNGALSWFPERILLSLPSMDARSLRNIVRQCRGKVEPHRKGAVSVTTAATRGPRKLIDSRVLDFAVKNVEQKSPARSIGLMDSFCDGSAASELAQLLSLDKPPSRIECYDISHTQGDFPVGSRVVFIDGKPAPHLYRKFNIKSVDGVNDYASIEEVLERRFNRAWVNGKRGLLQSSENPWTVPDLVVIDGGRGQLSAAIKGLSRANIVLAGSATAKAASTERSISVAICALAKDQELIYIDDQQDPVNDRPDSPAVLLLRALRDESHRFALSAHRQQRSVLKSVAAGKKNELGPRLTPIDPVLELRCNKP